MKNITILELSKSYVNKYYNGDLKKAINEKDGIVFDSKKIALTFGSLKEFERYKKDNSIFCHYVNI